MTVNNPPYAEQNASHSAALFRQAASSLIRVGGVVQNNECAVAQTGTPSMGVQVSAGRAWIPGNSVSNVMNNWSTQAMYFSLNDAAVTLTIAAADPTNPRIDLVYYQIQDSFYSGSNNQAVLGVVTGTPAPSPSAPAAPANSITLALVAVAASASSIVNANITDQRQPALVGGITSLASAGQYPSSPIAGEYVDDVTLGLRRWNGSNWLNAGNILHGSSSVTFSSSVTSNNPTVTFPSGGFPGTPDVAFSNGQITGSTIVAISNTSLTATNMAVRGYVTTGIGYSGSVGFSYVAVYG